MLSRSFAVYNQARRLREVLKGRLTQAQALRLLDEFGDPEPALDFVLNGEPDDVRHYLESDPSHVQNLNDEAERLADDLNRGVDNLMRQFACKDCLKSWWRRVPARKQVSKCHRCHQKYDCIPRNREWGTALFACECGNEFYGFGVMSQTQRVCHVCRTFVYPSRVFPPRKDDVQERRHDPFRFEIIATNIRFASKRHVSTGSTVSTYLTGGSYLTASVSERPPKQLRSIPEDDEGDE
ncbi:repressor of yield of DENV protein homolog [Elysia marginata]|uniref:Repressor of yield of DENV protein homolog n=1 Tax=Elysia marginata TaxID=1093978 RepID=A0AAV4FDN8_9GAST|nr:repressor of yield of DENV protein homolog [Elysia marginata]